MLGKLRSALVLLGSATAVAQVVLLREAMAALTGSELAWGAILGLWLVGRGGWPGMGMLGEGLQKVASRDCSGVAR